MFNPDCLLMRDGKDMRSLQGGRVDCTDCDCCGFAPEVERRRKEYARRYGLRTGKDGLRYIPAKPPEPSGVREEQ